MPGIALGIPDHLASGPVTQRSCSWNKAAFALAQWTGGLEQSPGFLSWASLCAMEQLPLPNGVGKLHYPQTIWAGGQIVLTANSNLVSVCSEGPGEAGLPA